MNIAVDPLRRMMLIRAFETALAKRRDHGFQLLSTGEEAVAVGLASALNDKDQLLTGGRSIGPALARGVDPRRVMAELLARSTGVNRGRGGRGHLSDPASGFFGAHAVVGGNISIAGGVALARKLEGQGGIVAILFGDGAAGAGALHETLNMAALWKLPLLFVCNNNQLSVSTPRQAALAPARISDIALSFGLPAQTIDGMDLAATTAALGQAAAHVRAGEGPAFVECISIRLRSHSTTARETRSREELARLWQFCPIERQISALGLDTTQAEALRAEAEQAVAEALAFADASPFPEASEVLDDVG
ncbi:Acetoin:2,6-dichlorophenolindophenol oxidoreductase subunit alpha [Labrys miyagiensis]